MYGYKLLQQIKIGVYVGMEFNNELKLTINYRI